MTRRSFAAVLVGVGQIVPLPKPSAPPWIDHPQQRCPLGHVGAREYGTLVVGLSPQQAEGRPDGAPLTSIVTSQRALKCSTCGVLFVVETR